MDTITRNVNELATADRTALEHMIGRPLQRDQQVLIAVLPSGDSADLTREEARARLLKTLQATAQRAAEAGISAEAADAIVAEACSAVRHRPAES